MQLVWHTRHIYALISLFLGQFSVYIDKFFHNTALLASFNNRNLLSQASILLFLFPKWIEIVEGQQDKNWFLMVIAVIKNAKWCPQLRARVSEEGTLNLPDLEGDWVISGSRPRILQMEKSVRDLLETGAKDGSPTETWFDGSIRDLLTCVLRTRESTRETIDFNWAQSIWLSW